MNNNNTQPFFTCNNHPNVEAVTFCEECRTMKGCSGYWCKECNDSIHKMFASHQRSEPKLVERKMCSIHPDRDAEEIFCWETKTFHCVLCACEEGIKGDTIPKAIEKITEDSKSGYPQLQKNIEKLSERKNKILFDLNGDKNPNNLEDQMREAISSIHSTFNELREAIDNRENALLKEVETYFNSRIEQFNNEAAELNEVIEKGNTILDLYNKLSTEKKKKKKNAELLKKLVDVRSVIEETTNVVNKYEDSPIIQASTKVFFESNHDLIQRINNLGKVTETTDIPAPQDFRTIEVMSNYVKLVWNSSETTLPITYQVMLKKADNPNNIWTECYNGPETKCRCTNLQRLTNYTFMVIPHYKSMKSANYSTCSALTVKSIYTHIHT